MMTTRAHTTLALLPWWLMLWLVTMISASNNITTSSDQYPIAKQSCQDRCGNISIPYPFGIGLHCSLNSWFNISCDTSTRPPTPSLPRLTWIFLKAPPNVVFPVQILGVDLDLIGSPDPTATLAITGTLSTVQMETIGGQPDLFGMQALNMTGSPYVLMGARNILVARGCGGSVVLMNTSDDNEIVAGCSTICGNFENPSRSGYMSCYGIGCCQTSIGPSLDYFHMEFLEIANSSSNSVQAAVFDADYIASKSINDSFSKDLSIPTILQWRAPDLPINSQEYSNSRCQFLNFPDGYSCECRSEYHRGNPYLPNGCQVIKECKDCPDTCVTTPTGDNSTMHSCPTPAPEPKKSAMPIALGLGISLGTLLLSILLYGLYRLLKQRKEIRQKQENFKRNGGLLLQQQLSASEGALERTKVYTSNELEKATDNFNVNRIVGRGGQGTVYKGMLDDGTIAAIKKSEKVYESSQLKQFINEVVILSQVNHRNIVKLLGSCLETEVPLLVYELVINGTLSQNIHSPTEEFQLTWKMRLQIAIQAAEALAYLHSSSDPPIYHRDVKTSNILLDDKYRAKVSDFGISKSIGIDQTHVTNTHVQGTFGYIDPEFFRSRQYTDRSDVYSFGIVLVELITSKKAVYEDNSLETISLASNFLDLKQNSRLYDIVDAKVLEEARKEELDGVADLAEQCLKMTGRQRPTMKEVVATLLMITSQHRAQIPSSNQISSGKIDLVGEFSSSNSVTYASSEEPSYIQEQPLFSSTDLSL